MKDKVIKMFSERGVELTEVAELVLELQKPYHPTLSLSECLENVEAVLEKREVQHAIITGIVLDTLAEHGLLPEPLQTWLVEDEPLYGIDEILAMAIINVYGTIGFTNFGYLDKTKPGVLSRLNSHPDQVHTFMDDLVAGLAAAACARLAHNLKKIVP
ncbi:MAG: phosphatidylglycerophosphatase A [Bacillota bacterium]|nr:phosphatidylglycerophosphatase A [Bacillota bacterium]